MEGLNLICCVHGACSGYPGVMGLGGAIFEGNGEHLLYSFSIAEGRGYKNMAELSALLHVLNKIREMGSKVESILVKCDSQLLYCQLTCGNRIEEHAIIGLYSDIEKLIKSLSCNVQFCWVPLEGNLLCCALAAKAAGMPFAVIEDNKVLLWKRTEVKRYEELDGKLPSINSETYINIQKLNGSSKHDISLLFSLMTYGIDKYSRAKPAELLQYVETRFNEYTKEYLIKVLEDLSTYYSKNVLRWTARGLYPDLAFLKASLETEIKEDS